MKKNTCLLIAFIAGIITFSFGSLSIKLVQDQTGLALGGSVTLFILQLLLTVKYSAGTFALLPSEAGLKQIALGFLTADITIGLWIVVRNGTEVFPLYLLIMQVSLLALNRKTENVINRENVLPIPDAVQIVLEGV